MISTADYGPMGPELIEHKHEGIQLRGLPNLDQAPYSTFTVNLEYHHGASIRYRPDEPNDICGALPGTDSEAAALLMASYAIRRGRSVLLDDFGGYQIHLDAEAVAEQNLTANQVVHGVKGALKSLARQNDISMVAFYRGESREVFEEMSEEELREQVRLYFWEMSQAKLAGKTFAEVPGHIYERNINFPPKEQ